MGFFSYFAKLFELDAIPKDVSLPSKEGTIKETWQHTDDTKWESFKTNSTNNIDYSEAKFKSLRYKFEQFHIDNIRGAREFENHFLSSTDRSFQNGDEFKLDRATYYNNKGQLSELQKPFETLIKILNHDMVLKDGTYVKTLNTKSVTESSLSNMNKMMLNRIFHDAKYSNNPIR